MTDVTPGNNLPWRVLVLERRLEKLEEGKPEVIAERVTRLAADLESLRRQMTDQHATLRREMHEEVGEVKDEQGSQRKILIGFFVSFALLAIGVALSYVLSGSPVSG